MGISELLGSALIEATDADGGCVLSIAINDSGYNASPGSGATDNSAAIRLLDCRRILVASSNITATDAATYFRTTAAIGRHRTIFSGNAVMGTYNGVSFNGQNRYINVTSNDVLGITPVRT